MKILIILSLITLIFGYKWLPTVTGYSESDYNNGYAGILGKTIVGRKIEDGVKFRIHYVGKASWEQITSGSAGDLKTKIDGIAISGKVYKVYANGRWLPAVTGFDINDDNNGYAGILGYEISGLMINRASYSVAILDGTTDNGGNEGGESTIISGSQTFVSTGTGVKGITPQYLVPNMKDGCFFMGCCVIGGLGSDAQIQDAYYWALNLGYINDKAWVTNIDGIALAKAISEHYGTTFHKGWSLEYGCNHYWVLDTNGKEVFNASGLYFIGNC